MPNNLRRTISYALSLVAGCHELSTRATVGLPVHAERKLVADDNGVAHRRGHAELLARQEIVEPRQIVRRHRTRHVIHREQTVGLAPAEVRLELHNRLAPGPRKPQSGRPQQIAKPLGHEGASKEGLRVGVLVDHASTGDPGDRLVHLPQVRRELRSGERSLLNVGERRCHSAPRLERPLGVRLDPHDLLLRRLGELLLLDLLLEGRHRLGNRAVDRLERQKRVVVRPVGSVEVERALVRPVVSGVLEPKEMATKPRAENLPEERVPRADVEVEPRLSIPLPRVVPRTRVVAIAEILKRGLFPVLSVLRLKALDRVVGKRLADQLQKVLDAFAVGFGHADYCNGETKNQVAGLRRFRRTAMNSLGDTTNGLSGKCCPLPVTK